MKRKIELEELDPKHWRPAYIFPKQYLVSDTGEVYSIKTKKLLKAHIGKVGYGYYVFCVAGKRHTVKAHRLIAMAFIPNSEHKDQVDHINGIKTDNRVENLRWTTIKENRLNPNTYPKQKAALLAKNQKPVAVYKDGCLIKTCESRKAAAAVAGVCPQTVSQCLSTRRNITQARGYTFKRVEVEAV